ncbi:hypothetical protein [Pelomicrobium sp. G1]|uniref:hypothetical protein n=1 Tax=unclassified Pelomicrobium TaxID=2815318 RepID=UPI0021DD163C|nr:MAG: hypothetical protein KatS3mg123_1334 [Burkholderiales bacterium]
MESETERDWQSYRLLMDLWARENVIKTQKLQVLLLANALLAIGVELAFATDAQSWPIFIYLAGFVVSLVWVFSIGRTVLFQDVWGAKLDDLAARYPGDARFHLHEGGAALARAKLIHRVAGAVPSKYYLIGAPALFTLFWLYVLLGQF